MLTENKRMFVFDNIKALLIVNENVFLYTHIYFICLYLSSSQAYLVNLLF